MTPADTGFLHKTMSDNEAVPNVNLARNEDITSSSEGLPVEDKQPKKRKRGIARGGEGARYCSMTPATRLAQFPGLHRKKDSCCSFFLLSHWKKDRNFPQFSAIFSAIFRNFPQFFSQAGRPQFPPPLQGEGFLQPCPAQRSVDPKLRQGGPRP